MFAACAGRSKGHMKKNHSIAWTTPPPDFVKLNIDGRVKSDSGLAEADGVVRNAEGA